MRPRSGVDCFELTKSLLACRDPIEGFLLDADAAAAFDDLLAESRAAVIPKLRRFPRIDRPYLNTPPQLVEALAQLTALLAGAPDALRIYLHGDYSMLYTAVEAFAIMYLLSIRHYRQLSSDSLDCGAVGEDANVHFAPLVSGLDSWPYLYLQRPSVKWPPF